MRSSDGTKRSSQPILRSGEVPSTALFPLRVGCLPSEMRSHLLYFPRDAPANVMKIKPLNLVSLRSCTLLLLSGHDSVPRNAACPSNSRFTDGKHCPTPLRQHMSRKFSTPRDVRRDCLFLPEIFSIEIGNVRSSLSTFDFLPHFTPPSLDLSSHTSHTPSY